VKGPAVRKTLLAALVSLPSLALASGYSLPNTNPRDLSLSASAVAAQRDSGAAFALPAALPRLDGLYVSIGAGVVTVGNTWTDPAPTPTPLSSNATSVDMDTVYTPFPNVSIGYGGKMNLLGERRWGVGLGLQPFGGAVVQWPDDWPGRYRIVKVDRQVFSGILSAGVEILPQVRLGGGVMYYYTKQKFTQHQLLPTPPVGALVDTTATLDQTGGEFSWDASIEVEPLKDLPLLLAFDYKHQAVQKLDGDVKWSNLPPAILVPRPGGGFVPVSPPSAAVPILQDQGVKEDLTIPNLINVGVSYRVIKPLLLTGTFTYDRWEVYAEDAFVGDVPGASLTVKRNYGNGQTYRVGAEYTLNPALELRVGVQRDISGLDTDFYSPTLPDASSWGGSLGLTFRFNKAMGIDAAFFYANMDEVKTTNAAAAEFPPSALPMRGTWNSSAMVGSLAFNWRPGAK
jgi:long-chain fatty acid transport protein